MIGDTYIAPGVGWLHALQKAGSSALNVPESLASGSTKLRLIDGRARPLCTWAAHGDKYVRTDRGVAVLEPVNRLYVPAGHNLAGVRFQIVTYTSGAWAGETQVLPYIRLHNATSEGASTAALTMRPGVNVVDFPSTTSRYIGVILLDRAATVPSVGEFWFTRMWFPVAGFDPGYEMTRIQNTTVNRTLANVVNVVELSEPSKRWRIDTADFSGADRLLWETLLIECGVQRSPFLFDATADHEIVIDDCQTSAASWSALGATGISNAAGVKLSGAASLKIDYQNTNDGGAATIIDAVDLRGCVLGVYVYCSARANWMTTGSDGLRIYLGNESSVTNACFATYWAFGTDTVASNSTWFGLWIDLENNAPAGISQGPVDLSAVTSIAVAAMTDGTIADPGSYYIGRIVAYRKDRAPIVARIMDAVPSKQKHPVPATYGEEFSMALTIEEMIA